MYYLYNVYYYINKTIPYILNRVVDLICLLLSTQSYKQLKNDSFGF